MTSMSMGGGYLRTRPIHGVPGLAIRIGRLLELWGRRAARLDAAPRLEADNVERHLQAERRARTALAAREATVNRAWYQGIR